MTARQRWLWLLLTVVAAAAFASLGAWQLGRAREKEQRLVRHERAQAVAPAPLAQALARQPRAELPWRARATGTLDVDATLLLDNQIRKGRAGVHAYAPLQLDGSSAIVLVDLGWLPLDARRRMPGLPPVPVRFSAQGWAAPPPSAGLKLAGALPSNEGPRLVTYLDLDALRAEFGETLETQLVFHPEPDLSSGYVREFQPAPGLPPERHRGYAVQWFGLALAVIVIFLVLGFRRR